MKYITFTPAGHLSAYIRSYWILEGNASKEVPYIHRTMANPSPEFLFHYKGYFKELDASENSENYFIAGIHAQTDRIRRFMIDTDFGIFGVCLQPYAIPALFGVTSFEVKNNLPDLTALLGQKGKDLTESMMLANTNEQRLQIITRFFNQYITRLKRPEIVYASQIIYRSRGGVNVKELAENCALSQRQFERKFKEYIGFSPKSFSRIVRFDALLNSYTKKKVPLVQMANDFGYYDQAHFINEFKKFSGYSPKQYFSGRAEEAFYPM